MLKRLLNHGAWSFFGTLINNLILIFSMIFFSKNVEQTQFSHIVIFQTSLLMISTLLSSGLGLSLTKFCSELRLSGNSQLIFKKILSIAVLFVVLILIFAITAFILRDFLTEYVFGVFGNSLVYFVLITSVFVISIDALLKSFLISMQKTKDMYISSIVASVISFLFIIYSVERFGANGPFYWFLIYYLLQLFFSTLCCYFTFGFNLKLIIGAELSLDTFFIILKFTAPAFLSSFLILPSHWIVQYFVKDNDSSLVSVALFGISMQWFNILSFIPNSISRVVLPLLVDSSNKVGRLKFLKVATLINIIICIPIFVVIAVLAKWILSLYGEQYIMFSWVFIIAITASLIMSIQLPIANVFASENKMWYGFSSNFIWAALYVFPSVIFAYNLYIVFSSLLVAYLVHSIFNYYFALKKLS